MHTTFTGNLSAPTPSTQPQSSANYPSGPILAQCRQPYHKVDGRTYIKSVAITSESTYSLTDTEPTPTGRRFPAQKWSSRWTRLSDQQVTVSHDDVFARDLPGILVDDDGNALMHFDEQVVSNRSTLSADAQELLPVLSACSLTIPGGGTGSYSVALGSQPDGDAVVTLRISPSDHLTASAEQLTFTPQNSDSPQTVTLTAGMDDDDLNFWREILHKSDVQGFVVGRLTVLTEDR